MRTLYYRVVEARVCHRANGYHWEAWLLIHGRGVSVKGDISSMEQLETSMHAAVAVAYQHVTGQPLPAPDGQLALL